MANATALTVIDLRKQWRAMAMIVKGIKYVLSVFGLTKIIGVIHPSITGERTERSPFGAHLSIRNEVEARWM